jgi:type II secretion system protein D
MNGLILALMILAAVGTADAQSLTNAPAVPPVAAQDNIPPEVIQFPNNPISDFLLVYERLQGAVLIKDATLLGGGANLSLSLNQPVSREDAIRLIESTLLLNGYAFIAVDNPQRGAVSLESPQAPIEKPWAIKVINTQGGKNPRSEGVYLAQKPEDVPTGEVIASFVMQLNHLAAAEAVPIFEQFITLHPYGSLVAVPLSNQVLITENSTLIRRLIEVQALVDLPRDLEKEFVPLEQANADRVVELITQILEKQAENRVSGDGVKAVTGQPAQPPGLPGLPAGAAGSSGGGQGASASVGDIQLIADTRTNRILVIADKASLEYIKTLIQEFDVAVEIGTPFVQLLNYVAAADMLPILADILQEEGDEGGGGSSEGSGPNRTTTGGIGSGDRSGNQGGVSGSGQIGNLEEPGNQQAAQSVIVGKTRLIADNRANAILVIGQPEARDKVRAILDKLDKRPMQVYLSTVIGDLTVNNNDEFAVNILQKYIGGPQTGAASVAGGRNFISPSEEKISFGSGAGNAGIPYTYTDPGTTPLSPAAATMAQMSQVAVGALPGMQIATFILGSIDLYINALTSTARFRIASRPSVFTSNNKKAVIFNGRKIAVPTSTVTTLGAGGNAGSTTGSQQSNIQYQDVVLKIEVVPLINSAREITLQIIQTNDNVIPGASTQIGGGVSVPEIATQELTTTVTVPDRSTILLGGLITQRDSKTTAGVPFLSSIPLMGNLFKSTADTTDRQELVVMIQPSVVQDIPEMREISKTERDLTGFSSKELSPLSMKVGAKTTAPDIAPLSAPEELPAPPTQE